MPTFYDLHATDFSKSRFRIWPHVKQFLDDLPPNFRVLDIGCGNGKNMTYRQDLQMVGLEHSQSLTDICVEKGLKVLQGDARQLPFEANTFDAIIMIAVIHHINPDEHIKVLNEIKRVLKTNGTCLITNWAVEQPEDSRRSFHLGLNMITWKGKEENPLPYWVINEEIANKFVEELPNGIVCSKLSWDAGNWEFWLKKL